MPSAAAAYGPFGAVPHSYRKVTQSPVFGMQMHSKDLQQVLDVVVSHQALELKCELVVRLLYALVAPEAEHFRPLLRRLAGLVGEILQVSPYKQQYTGRT